MVPLGELCDIVVGRTPSRSDPASWGEGFPWLSIADMAQGRRILRTKEQITEVGARTGKLISPGTVLLSFKLSIGKVGIAQVPLFTNEAIAALPIKNPSAVDSGYLAYALQSIDLYAGSNRAAMGATLNKAALSTIPVRVPSMTEQRRIAAILDKADAIRAKRRQVLAHLDALTQSIFHGVIACVSPDRTSFERLESFVDAGDRMNYGVVQPGEDVAAGVALVRVGDLADGRVDRRNLKRVSAEVEAPYARSRLKGNEILVSCVGSIGTVSLASAVDAGSNIARAITRIPISDEVTRGYVAAVLRSEASQRYFRAELRTVAQPTLNVRQLAATPIPVLTRDAQVALVTRLDRISAARELTSKEVVVHEGLFASLQSRAFKGEL